MNTLMSRPFAKWGDDVLAQATIAFYSMMKHPKTDPGVRRAVAMCLRDILCSSRISSLKEEAIQLESAERIPFSDILLSTTEGP